MWGMNLFSSLAIAGATVAGLAQPAVAQAAATGSTIAYVRGGDIYVSSGAGEKRLTTGGGHSRLRWSADGRSMTCPRHDPDNRAARTRSSAPSRSMSATSAK